MRQTHRLPAGNQCEEGNCVEGEEEADGIQAGGLGGYAYVRGACVPLGPEDSARKDGDCSVYEGN